jgi:predicted dehydrogenase
MPGQNRQAERGGLSQMAQHRIGIVMNGVTGRMGTNQHLIRSIAAIRADGGVKLKSGDVVMPDPILVGRNEAKLAALAQAHGITRWTTDLDAALANPDDTLFFDAASTQARARLVRRAIEAGKHVYCEKPSADSLADAVAIARLARQRGIKHGVVQDKLFLPGIRKLKLAIDSGFLGRILSVRGEFGYWVFEGDWQPAQRPSWNYKKAEGGGIILDMLCHWRYVLDNTFGAVKSVSCLGAVHIPDRVDENGARYHADADDAAYATFQLEGGIVAHINSSWCTRVRRDDLVTFHVDGTLGSAVAGLQKCRTQARVNTPKPVWNPDIAQPIDFFEAWQEMPDTIAYPNGFRAQWEQFLRHVAGEVEAFPWNLEAGAKGVQLAEAGLQSWKERRWIDLPALEF